MERTTKDLHEVLQQKEADLQRIRHEIESLHIVALLLSDEIRSNGLMADEKLSAQRERDLGNGEAIRANAMFSSIAAPRPGFWKALKRGN